LHRREKIATAIHNGECYVAKEAASIIGFAIMSYHFFELGFIDLLIVAEEHRHSGIGIALLDYLSNQCKTDKLFSSTNESNLPMRGLLAKTGFIHCGQIDALDECDPELFFVKRKDEESKESTPEELSEALRSIASTLSKCEKAHKQVKRNPKPDSLDDVIDEIVDVEMMLAQMRVAFDIDDETLRERIESKFAKLAQYLESGE
jgi:N-acetylglutamate synthase-like GNAT family acetyltransferase